jgi:hypothetical protein
MTPCTAPEHVYQVPGGRPLKVPAQPPHVFSYGDGHSDFSCMGRSIQIGGNGWSPRLTFVEDRLAGYTITVRVSLYRELLAIASEKFGSPERVTTRTYRTKRGTDVAAVESAWSWPSGTSASLVELCSATDVSCLIVTTKSLDDYYKARGAEERERAKKGF